MLEAILFDLDETLIPEEKAVARAFRATADAAAPWLGGVDPERFAHLSRVIAKRLWHELPTHEYCHSVGISSEEGLWATFDGEAPNRELLRRHSAAYRRNTWAAALHAVGARVAPDRVRILSEVFGRSRREGCRPFPHVVPTMKALSRRYKLGIVTNGPACLQREKLKLSRLQHFFPAVIISGEIGIGKPEPEVFQRAVFELKTDVRRTIMIGDNLERDVHAATRAGIGAAVAMRVGRPDMSWGGIAVDHVRELPLLFSAQR
jgi:putative hydrolase of the HAD superfamily